CIDDFSDSAAMWADPAVTRYIGDKPLTEEESWTKFLRYVGHWSLLGFGYWWLKKRRQAILPEKLASPTTSGTLNNRSRGCRKSDGSSRHKRTAKGMRRKRFGQSLPGATFTSGRCGPPASSLLRTLPRFGSPSNVDTVNSSARRTTDSR